MLSSKDGIKELLDLLHHGHRLTPTGRKRFTPRWSRWTVNYDPQGVVITDRWRGNYEFLRWLPVSHTLLVNSDRISALYFGQIWRWLADWEQPALPISFAAARLAGIQLQTILPVVVAPAVTVERKRTLPEETPDWVKHERYQYVYNPATNKHDFVRQEKEPAWDGFFHWNKYEWTQDGVSECVFRALWSRFNRGRGEGRSLFLSGWDSLDRPPRYFLAQLPDVDRPPKTMDQAREILKPAAVKLAEQQHLRIVRQGDVFAIETTATKAELMEKMRTSARYSKWGGQHHSHRCGCGDKNCFRYFHEWEEQARTRGPWGYEYTKHHYLVRQRDLRSEEDYSERLCIHGTTHTATEIITLRDGQQYGRGRLIHQPLLGSERRPRDHRDVWLGDGKTWWLLVRNTVPAA